MSKPKARPSPTSVSGLIKPDVIRDVADSLGIPAVSEVVSSALASDVEYRIHQVVDEAARFMRHARRTVLTTSDIEQALRVLNIEPLYGHSPHAPLTFRRAPPAGGASQTGAVFFVEDEEIEFERTVREYKIAVPRPTRWTAHWLAVEGVQPLIPENPPAIPRESDAPPDGTKGALAGARAPAATATVPGSGGPHAVSTQALTAGKTQHLQQQQLVKQVLSRELQLYYTRLTSSLLPGQPGTPAGAEEAKRDAALASVRHDAGLQALVPYLVRWVGEGVVALLKTSETSRTDADGTTLATYMDVISALLGNSTLFVEPYLHQLLPPVLSTLLHAALPATHARHLRVQAADMVTAVLKQHSATYPSLAPRIMKTLLLALISPGRSKGTREGAVRGLVAVGKEAIRKGLVECGGARVIADECVAGETNSVIGAVRDALVILCPPSDMAVPLREDDPEEASLIARSRDTLGGLFADSLIGDGEQVRAILGGTDDMPL